MPRLARTRTQQKTLKHHGFASGRQGRHPHRRFQGHRQGHRPATGQGGAIVAVINRDDGAAEQFAAEMKAITDNYRTYLMDLNDTDDIAPIVEDVVKTYGHIDGLVNNADRNDNLDLDHTSWREFEQSLHGNLTHYYELAHRCAPYLRESKGAIVNISSKTALAGQGKTSAYAANLLVFDASKGVHFHDEVFKDTVYFMNNVFCNTSTTPTQWYRKTDALAKAAFSNNDYYEAGGKASDTQPEDKRGLEVDPKFVGFSGGSDTPAGKLAGMAPKPRPTSTRHTPPPSCAWASTPSRPACSGRRR
ncbi:oxidoreductase, short chain dehydrogenase/reductase family protein [Bifidobacterium bifidum NCIMB 41171]|nr:oxidoreductase, short chain dehydrogenase/reductase family protein [Bifidobacterium bifidum NCIMB 41171]